MQINIDKKTGIFIGIIVLLLAVIINMGMSRNDNRDFFGMHSFGMMDLNETRGSLNLTAKTLRRQGSRKKDLVLI